MTKSPKRILNLDLPANQRWNDILDEFNPQLEKIKPILIKLIEQYIGKLYYLISPIIKTFSALGKIMYYDEIKAISEKIKISFEYVLMLQLCYEASACCTSIATKVNNINVFFRTMDWPLDFLKDLTIDLEFQKKGKTVFYATSWIGYVGILTATVPEKYSLAVNFRNTKNLSISSVIGNITSIISMYWPIGYLIRHICEENMPYEKMLHHLHKTYLVSPCYITVCNSSNEPVVITRDPVGYKDMNNNYIVQTNCDQCDQNKKYLPNNILYSLQRSKLANKIIKKYNNNFESIENLVSLLFNYPIDNDETIYYSIMIPSENIHYSIIVPEKKIYNL